MHLVRCKNCPFSHMKLIISNAWFLWCYLPLNRCVSSLMSECMHACMALYVCMNVSMYVYYVGMCACVHACLYGCMACMYECMHHVCSVCVYDIAPFGTSGSDLRTLCWDYSLNGEKSKAAQLRPNTADTNNSKDTPPLTPTPSSTLSGSSEILREIWRPPAISDLNLFTLSFCLSLNLFVSLYLSLSLCLYWSPRHCSFPLRRSYQSFAASMNDQKMALLIVCVFITHHLCLSLSVSQLCSKERSVSVEWCLE